jgi:serine phosphatase RsbU (regulator of sigma subunit)
VLETGRPVVDFRTSPPRDIRHRSVSYCRLTDRSGRVLGIAGLLLDVTDRIEAAAKVERARSRLGLLNDVGGILASSLDVQRLAGTLAEALVPAFCDYSGVLLPAGATGATDEGDMPRRPYGPGTPLVVQGSACPPGDERAGKWLRTGRPMPFPDGSPPAEILAGRRASWRAASRAELHDHRAVELGVDSVLVAPLRARGTVLGLLIVGRDAERAPFDADDLALAIDLADRAGATLDNARLYALERQDTLMLQRSLLPQHVPRLPGIEIAHRYLPGSTGAEAGGDWFDVVPLAGGRVAFVVGDVMGHGLRAAATMGRLRTAVHTLAGLDLPPDEVLRRVDALSTDFVLSPDEPIMATCLYAVYDPSTRICSIAKAGHLPPLLVHEEDGPQGRQVCRVQPVEMPAGVPIGLNATEFAAVDFEAVELLVPPGAVLVLYTDGLVEARGEDLDEGLGRLCRVLSKPHASLEDACDDLLSTLVPASEPDDVALLMARLAGPPVCGESC